MKALTIWPEWCWAMRCLGKNVENRTWSPPLNRGTTIAIHAGAHLGGKARGPAAITEVFGPVQESAEGARWKVWCEPAENKIRAYHLDRSGSEEVGIFSIPRGAVVGMATYSGLLQGGDGLVPWWDGPPHYGWMLSDFVWLARPVPCRGSQGLWDVPEEIERDVYAQVSRARSCPFCGGDLGYSDVTGAIEKKAGLYYVRAKCQRCGEAVDAAGVGKKGAWQDLKKKIRARVGSNPQDWRLRSGS